MLDEPPLMVRMHGLTGFMDGSFVTLQSERNRFCARGPVLYVKGASLLWTARDVDGYRGDSDINLPTWPYLDDVQHEPKTPTSA
jgi:hypothetical protein